MCECLLTTAINNSIHMIVICVHYSANSCQSIGRDGMDVRKDAHKRIASKVRVCEFISFLRHFAKLGLLKP